MLGRRDEFRRRHGAALEMLPAHQRLDADDAFTVGGQERLIEHPQLVARQRLRKLALGLAALVQRFLVAGVEHAQRAAAFGARAVERDVGAPQQRLGVVRVFRGDARRRSRR